MLYSQKWLFVPLLLLLSMTVAGRQADSDELDRMLDHADSSLKSNDIDAGLRIVESTRPSLTGEPLSRARFYWLYAELLYKQKKYLEMEPKTDTLLSLSKKSGDRQWQIRALHQKAAVNIHRGQLTDAGELINQAIALSIAAKERFLEARGYQMMGQMAFQGRQIPEVKKQYSRAIEIYEELGNDEAAAMLMCSMSRSFVAESSIYLDSAFAWNNRAKALAHRFPANLELQYFIWQNEADYLARGGDFKKAETAFDQAEKVARQMPSLYSLGGLLQVRSYAAFNAGNTEAALRFANESKDVFIAMGDFPMLKKSYQLLEVINESRGDYKGAYEALSEYVDISDSIFTQQSLQQINDLNIKYETSEKERLLAEKDLILSRKNANMRLLLISLVAIGAILVLSVFLYMQRRKTYQQNLLTLKREQDISLLKALMTGEEKERSRLARELHDGLGGILAAAQMQISQAGPSQQNDGIQKAADLVNQAAVESRRIAHNLLPETLLRYGLDEALRGYCKSITDSKLLQVDYQSQGMHARLEQSVELSIYRIVQELINNIVKHAGASEAFVQVQRNGDSLAITVEDDGKGFAPTRKDGIGLSNISSRISYLNGTMDIKSGQQKGTSVFIEIQLNKYAAG